MITINDKALVTDTIFSGGELNIKLPTLDLKFGDSVTIDCRSTDPLTLTRIGLIVNAIRNNYKYLNPSIRLNIPYLPYARQDRVCNFGEAYGIEYVLDYLHSLNLDSIFVLDVHSTVCKNIILEKKYDEFKTYKMLFTPVYITNLYDRENIIQVLPDAGTKLRYRNCTIYSDFREQQHIAFDRFKKQAYPIVCSKVREAGNVSITFEKIQDRTLAEISSFNAEFLISDDICDGGATFISIVNKLKHEFHELFASRWVPITLFVTHGIFRNGTDELYDAGITRIVTTDSLPQDKSLHKGEFNVIKV